MRVTFEESKVHRAVHAACASLQEERAVIRRTKVNVSKCITFILRGTDTPSLR